MDTASLINLWPGTGELADDLGVDPQLVRKWRMRGSIPARHWRALCDSAHRRGIEGVSPDVLMLIAEAPERVSDGEAA